MSEARYGQEILKTKEMAAKYCANSEHCTSENQKTAQLVLKSNCILHPPYFCVCSFNYKFVYFIMGKRYLHPKVWKNSYKHS